MKPSIDFSTVTRSLGLQVLLFLSVISATQPPTVFADETSSNSCAIEISRMRVLPGQLIYASNSPNETEACELVRALQTTGGRAALLKTLEAFLQGHPGSGWEPSLRAAMGSAYAQIDRTTPALENWATSWHGLQNASTPELERVREKVLVNYGRLLARLGRTDELEKLAREWGDRKLSRPDFKQQWMEIVQALHVMNTNPGASYRCGSFALGEVIQSLAAHGNLGSNNLVVADKFLQMHSPEGGFSLADLTSIAKSNNVDFLPVRRPEGTEEIPAPSVIHWKQNHYAAITEKRGSNYFVIDPTFGNSRFIPASSINAEASGTFLVAASSVPRNWTVLPADQAATIKGKGFPNTPPKPPPCPGDECDAPSSGNSSVQDAAAKPSTCKTCPPCTTGPGGAAGGAPGGRGSPASPGLQAGGGCGGSCYQHAGMAEWSVSEPLLLLDISDTPMFYQTARGGQFSLKVNYKQYDPRPFDDEVFGLGYNWNLNWLAYIDFDDGGNPAWHDEPAKLLSQYAPGGGLRTFEVEGAAQYGSYDFVMSGTTDRVSQVQVAPFGIPYGQVITNTDSTPYTQPHVLTYPDGRQDYYGFVVTNIDEGTYRYFRTRSVDRSGLETDYIYTNVPVGVSIVTQLKNVVDKDGNTNWIGYSDTKPYLITSVTNPYNAVVAFTYDDDDRLTNITDVVQVWSRIDYDTVTNGLVLPVRLVTPYGTNQFEYGGDEFGRSAIDFYGDHFTNAPGALSLYLRVTQPDGGKHLFVYRDNSAYLKMDQATPFLGSYQNETNSVYNTLNLTNDWYWLLEGDGNYWNRNSFYWGPRQYDACNPSDVFNLTTNQYLYAFRRHWLHGADGHQNLQMTVSSTLSMVQEPSLDGVNRGPRIWYGHEGKLNTYAEGIRTQPSVSVRETGQGWYQIDFMAYNSVGEITTNISIYTDPASGAPAYRTNFQVYAANDRDLLEAYDAAGVRAEAYGYDANGKVLHYTNAVGDVTHYLYNGIGQEISVKTPAGLTTTNVFDVDGWLSQIIELETGKTNSYTFNQGLLASSTDERGLIVSNSWDALQRLRRVDYPDGSFVTNIYTNLDLVRTVDRMGFSKSFAFDSMRRLAAVTNALGYAVLNSYCTCGSLESVRDAQGRTNNYFYDNQGRLVQTRYPDGYYVSRNYNVLDQVTNTVDSGGVSVTNWYNAQGLIGAVSNAFGRVSVSTYDLRDRVMTNVDANGVVIAMTYDDLGRMRTRTYPDSGIERFGYSTNGLVAYTNQLNFTNYFTNDVAGRKIAEQNANGEVTRYNYDSSGNLTNLVDGKNQNTYWKYDEFGRVTNKIDQLGNLLFTYRYDNDNRLTNRWTPAKAGTAYKYDVVGNLTNIQYSVSSNISLAYDANNRLTNLVDGIGVTHYGYDAAGQLLSEDGPWASDTVSYSYVNRLRTGLSLAQPNASAWVQSYAWDAARRLTNTTSPAGAFGYAYDPTRNTQVQSLSLPPGAKITNNFDNVARQLSTTLINSTNGVLNSHSYSYNVGNQRTSMMNLHGDNRIYTYDKIGQLGSATAREVGSQIRDNEGVSYNYDKAGNLTTRVFPASLLLPRIENFGVNSLNELTNYTHGTQPLTVIGTTTSSATNVTVNTTNATLYADATFAARGFTMTNGINTYTAIARDAYGRKDTNTVVANLPATILFAYDLNGNMVTNGTRFFDYDDENQLIRITEPNAWKSEFSYDGKMRRRIRKEFTWSSGSWLQTNEVHYVYDGNLVIQERDANNLAQVSYTRGRDLSGSLESAGGIGGLLARTDNLLFAIGDSGAHAFYHADGNGNITCLISTSQEIAARYLYDPFGNTLAATGPLADSNLYRFSSKEIHLSSGLVYFLYRFYEARLQRWHNVDPVKEFGFELLRKVDDINERATLNAYLFIKNDPINRVDPFGLSMQDKIDQAKSAVEMAQKIRDILAAAQSGKGCACLDTATAVICQCAMNAYTKGNAQEMAQCFCVPYPDVDGDCMRRAMKITEGIIKAKNAAGSAKNAAK